MTLKTPSRLDAIRISRVEHGMPLWRPLMTIRGHTFFVWPLRPGCIVLDFGANRGDFAKQVSSRFGAKCYSVEANPQFASEIPKSDSVQVFNYAIGGDNEDIVLHLHKDPLSSSTRDIPSEMKTGDVRVPGRSLDTFLAENGITAVDLLKVDIEGAEVPLFDRASNASLETISQIAVEFHDFLGLISASDVARIVERLKGAGFYPIKFSLSNANWLFVRPSRTRVGPLQRAYARYIYRYVRGLGNKLGLLEAA